MCVYVLTTFVGIIKLTWCIAGLLKYLKSCSVYCSVYTVYLVNSSKFSELECKCKLVDI